jgi:hypothetical protein
MINRLDIWGDYSYNSPLTAPPLNRRGLDSLTDNILIGHFRAKTRAGIIGLHTTSKENTSLWGAVEVDWHEEGEAPPETRKKLWSAALHWFTRLRELGFSPLLSDSNGRGGFHLLILFESSVSSPGLYAFLQHLISDFGDLGLEKCPETFPKQARIKPGGCGNFLRLFGRHYKYDHYSKFWNGAAWLEGNSAIDFILAIPRASPDLLPKIQDAAAAYQAHSQHPSVDPVPPSSKRGPGDEKALALEALDHLSSQRAVDYDTWLEAGMALHSVDQSQEMCERWDRWSSACQEKYQPGACAKKWATFNKAGGKGIGSLIHWARETGWSPKKKVYQSALGSRFVFQMLHPHVTPSGGIKFQLAVVQGKKTIFRIPVTGARRVKKDAVNDLVRELQLSDAEKVELENILEKFVVAVPGEAEREKEEAVKNRESIAQIVTRHLQGFQPKFQDGLGGIYFEKRGLLRRHELVGVTPQLVAECRVAVDAPPANSKGVVPLPSLLRTIKAAIEVGWGNLLQTLGPPHNAQLLHTSRAAQEFRVALNTVFKRTGTWESNGVNNQAIRASLASRARDCMNNTKYPPRYWTQIIRNVDAAWIIEVLRKTGWHHHIGIRWDLPVQIAHGLSLPNVSSQDDLFKLGVMFGVVDPHPQVLAKVNGQDLAILTDDFVEQMLGDARGSDDADGVRGDAWEGPAAQTPTTVADAPVKMGPDMTDAERREIIRKANEDEKRWKAQQAAEERCREGY